MRIAGWLSRQLQRIGRFFRRMLESLEPPPGDDWWLDSKRW